jgi:cytochrome b561
MQKIADPSVIPTDRGRYSTVAIALHWTTAAAIAMQVLMGWRMAEAEGLGRAYLLQLHKSVGIAILLLTAGRLIWRAVHPPPAPAEAHSAVERRAAAWVHGGFYALLLALPLTGWALSSLTQSGGLKLFSVIPWPAFPLIRALPGAAQDGLAAVSDTAHTALVWVMLALLALHVLGALKHHFISRDFTLSRMIRGVQPGQFANARLAAVPLLALGLWGAVYLPKLPQKAPRPPPPSLAQADLYLDVVQPMLDRRCSGCHSDGDARGAFSLASYESLSRGGRSGPVVIPGDPVHSTLFRRITMPHSEARFMPKGDRPALKPAEVEALAAWIEVGAPGQGAVGSLKVSDKQKAVFGKLIGDDEGEGGAAAPVLAGRTLPVVPKADPAVIRALEASGWVVRPVDENSNLLDVNFTVRRDLNEADYANLGKVGAQLYTLSIFQGGVKDSDLKTISAFPNLMRLRLADNPITDAGVGELGRMKSLRQLTLAQSDVGDAGLIRLAEAPAIERIYAWKTKATKAGAEQVEAGHPKLQVEVGLSRTDVPAPGPLMQPIN